MFGKKTFLYSKFVLTHKYSIKVTELILPTFFPSVLCDPSGDKVPEDLHIKV